MKSDKKIRYVRPEALELGSATPVYGGFCSGGTGNFSGCLGGSGAQAECNTGSSVSDCTVGFAAASTCDFGSNLGTR